MNMQQSRTIANNQAGQLDYQNQKQEEELNKQKAAQAEQSAKAAANQELNQKRGRQKALRAEQVGRAGTILTSPLGEGLGSAAPAPASGQKTLLGA